MTWKPDGVTRGKECRLVKSVFIRKKRKIEIVATGKENSFATVELETLENGFLLNNVASLNDLTSWMSYRVISIAHMRKSEPQQYKKLRSPIRRGWAA